MICQHFVAEASVFRQACSKIYQQEDCCFRCLSFRRIPPSEGYQLPVLADYQHTDKGSKDHLIFSAKQVVLLQS